MKNLEKFNPAALIIITLVATVGYNVLNVSHVWWFALGIVGYIGVAYLTYLLKPKKESRLYIRSALFSMAIWGIGGCLYSGYNIHICKLSSDGFGLLAIIAILIFTIIMMIVGRVTIVMK